MKKSKKRNIALICDDAYVMPTAVTIKSIVENAVISDNEELNIYICTFGISDKNRVMLKGLSTDLISVDIKEVDISKYEKRFKSINQKSHVTPTSLLKFELPLLFSEEDRLVYLDSDIIVKGNIVELFDIDVSNYYIAASPELWKYINDAWDNSDFNKDLEFYFNSGVMLMNLDTLRKDNMTDQLWKVKYDLVNNSKSTTMDQDTLNVAFKDKVKPLSIIWNCNVGLLKKVNLQLINSIFNENFSNMLELKDQVRVFHYVGKEDKPWKYLTANERLVWDDYYLRCGFDINVLSREAAPHGPRRYLRVIANVYRKNGLGGTLRFALYKLGLLNLKKR